MKKNTKEDCKEALNKAAKELGKSPTYSEYKSLDISPSITTIRKYYGSWNEAKVAAGLETLETNPTQFNYDGCPDILSYSKEEWKKLSASYKSIHRKKAKVAELKINKGCKNCAFNDHPMGLIFHHKNPNEKIMSVSNMVSDGYSWQKICDEIDKCEILCRNCHQIEEHGDRFNLS